MISEHDDYGRFKDHKKEQRLCGREILENVDKYRGELEERLLDPTEMMRLFVERNQPKEFQYKEAHEGLKELKLTHLVECVRPPGYGVEGRAVAKEELVKAVLAAYEESPEKSMGVFAYANKDVRDLNAGIREGLKERGFLFRVSELVSLSIAVATQALKQDKPFLLKMICPVYIF